MGAEHPDRPVQQPFLDKQSGSLSNLLRLLEKEADLSCKFVFSGFQNPGSRQKSCSVAVMAAGVADTVCLRMILFFFKSCIASASISERRTTIRPLSSPVPGCFFRQSSHKRLSLPLSDGESPSDPAPPLFFTRFKFLKTHLRMRMKIPSHANQIFSFLFHILLQRHFFPPSSERRGCCNMKSSFCSGPLFRF